MIKEEIIIFYNTKYYVRRKKLSNRVTYIVIQVTDNKYYNELVLFLIAQNLMRTY